MTKKDVLILSGAYFVNLPDIINAGNKIKTVQRLNAAIFSNQNTYITSEASQGEAEQLIAMLTEKHPEIDAANGRALSDREYEKMRMDWQEGRIDGSV